MYSHHYLNSDARFPVLYIKFLSLLLYLLKFCVFAYRLLNWLLDNVKNNNSNNTDKNLFQPQYEILQLQLQCVV